jgi:hypothetical protein
MKKLFAVAVLSAVAAFVAPATASAIGPDVDGRTPVVVSASTGQAFGEALCSNTTPTLIGGLVSRQAITVQNLGPNPIYLCTTNTGCTVDTGIKLSNGDPPLTFDMRHTIKLYCIAASAAQVAKAGARFIEVR